MIENDEGIDCEMNRFWSGIWAKRKSTFSPEDLDDYLSHYRKVISNDLAPPPLGLI